MKARMRVRGFKESAHKIEVMARVGGDSFVSGLRVIGEEIMTDVKASRPGAGVPVDEGALRASGRVTGPEVRGSRAVVTLAFGGSAAPYALRQHEELQYRHTVGEARYLVRGAERWARGSRPADALREMMDAAVAAGKSA